MGGLPQSAEERSTDLADELIDDLADGSSGPADPFSVIADEEQTEAALGTLPAEATERGKREDANKSFWRELPILIIVALVVAVLIKTFLVQAFFIPTESMYSTLTEGDRVMVNKLSYVFGSPSRGDIVVFDNPSRDDDGESLLGAVFRHIGESLGMSSPDSALIKRVIAVGGETIEIREQRVFIDGEAIDEPYLDEGVRLRNFGPQEVPDGFIFVMGDNRGSSHDSRAFGPIPEGDIVGRAFVMVWPPSRWGGV
jgi:signal peptidase I